MLIGDIKLDFDTGNNHLRPGNVCWKDGNIKLLTGNCAAVALSYLFSFFFNKTFIFLLFFFLYFFWGVFSFTCRRVTVNWKPMTFLTELNFCNDQFVK